MTTSDSYDAVVVGAGPNGLGAAVTLALAGRSVLVVEAAPTIGGGTRSTDLTLPGFTHDVCSAVHPFALASRFLTRLPLADHGLAWRHPPTPLAHPLDDGTAAVLRRSLAETALGLGRDRRAYVGLMGPVVRAWDDLTRQLANPLSLPRAPLALSRAGLRFALPARGLLEGWFSEEPARALIAGIAAHSFQPLERIPTAAFGLLLGAAGHTVGWPVAAGGSQAVADALASYLRSLGGEVVTGWRVESVDDLPRSEAVLLDLSPRPALAVAGSRWPSGYRRRLAHWRYGPGAFKVDYALGGPVPWSAPGCAEAGTLHLGGSLTEIAAGERAVARGEIPDRPYLLVSQPGVADPSRAPHGRQTLWVYCHVPPGCPEDMTDRIERQLERFAPGFRDRVLARHVTGPAALEQGNPNYVGGDIAGGSQDLAQLVARPTLSLSPHRTPAEGIYLCSSATLPGPGVHGLCGYLAARAVIGDQTRRLRRASPRVRRRLQTRPV